ncbi:MAG: IS21 family transposase [Polyangiaceae bacterium]|jgi:transposase|nr:IS21 family transposase [Polyangiaceae bacterium]
MIPDEQRGRIRRLFFAEHWKVGTIATELGVHHDTVELAIEPRRFVNRGLCSSATLLDAYLPFVAQTLEQYPRLRATRLFEMIRDRGYKGSVYAVRRHVRRVRPAHHEAFFRLTVLPGEQAQVDWGSFGKIRVGQGERALSCFVMVLASSRATFARFTLDQTLESFVRCHVEAFQRFGGVPRAVLYDNLKSVVIERQGDLIRFHPRILELAGHYHFAPTPVGIARGNEKGRVERRIRDLREAFFAARSFSSLADLNQQLDAWIDRVVHGRRVPGDAARTVAESLADEQQSLLPLPEHAFDPCHVQSVASGKTPYVRFDRNDYSIPHTLVRKPLTLVASETTVRVLDGDKEIARHQRSWDTRRQIEDQAHLSALAREKRKARDHRGRNRLVAGCPSAHAFLGQIALHGGHLGGTTTRLLHLLDTYGATDLDAAIAEAHRRDAFAAQSVAHILDQRARARGAPAPIEVVLPDDPRVRDLVVTPHALHRYDHLAAESLDSAPEDDQ